MQHINDNEIAASLRVVVSRLVKIVRSELRNDDLLSLTERSTLGLVYQNSEMLPSELAGMEKVSSQAMSQVINKLFKNGYIKKRLSKTDKRKVVITITALGKTVIENKRNKAQEWLAQSIAEKTTLKEKEVLVNAIKVLTKLVDLK